MKSVDELRAEGYVAVLVTTAHRGVFQGYVPAETPLDVTTLRIERARMAIYWSADVQGVFGLAANGPSNGCKIGPAVPALTVRDITSVAEVSAAARDRWETAPWSR